MKKFNCTIEIKSINTKDGTVFVKRHDGEIIKTDGMTIFSYQYWFDEQWNIRAILSNDITDRTDFNDKSTMFTKTRMDKEGNDILDIYTIKEIKEIKAIEK
jgi:hypothetical protein